MSDFSNSTISLNDFSNSFLINIHIFTYEELKTITQGFSKYNYLGEGGFGEVYKGFVDDSLKIGLKAQPVAVKALKREGGQGHREWLAEVIILGQLKHPHLVNLIGYCCEDDHRLLVYEYMERGNLEEHLFQKYGGALPWLTRVKILLGAAKGLEFLHKEEKPVIYRDFKPSNILLSSDFSSKLSDFGLATDGSEGEDSNFTKSVMGTEGYAAPEYISAGQLTTMSDVFSFGVVLLEMLTARKAIYDLLCLEGLAQALRVFNKKQEIPTYRLADISKDKILKMQVKSETSKIRPYVVCAVLRGVTFDEARYNSFIDLQDKLHQNICRRRSLVAIGTHDLDTLQGPFTYEALPPTDINFVPLKQTKSFRADELIEFYKSDLKLKKYLHIIENSPVFPVLYDSKRTVLSLPPIINGAHSAITLQTKNVFIECTATDLTKAKIVLNTMVTTFSEYCERKFEIEPVEVTYDSGKSYIYPDLAVYEMEVPLSYITDSIGVSLEAEEVTSLLTRMQLHAERSKSSDNQCAVKVHVPPSRSDVLHPCDVMEDVAIAYGFNNIPTRKPASIKPLSLNELTDLLRTEIAMNVYTEVLTWILCSRKENFALLNRKDDNSAVIIGNPRSADFEAMRRSLMPGILKTVGSNKDHPKPIKIYEIGDVALLDESKDVGASNRRHLAALHCGATSGFELIHGLVDRLMEVMAIPFVPINDNTGYYIKLSQEPEFLPGRQASIVVRGKHVGNFGIVHPQVLNNFDITDPCSFVEIDIEALL